MLRIAGIALALLTLTACQPPAADDYLERELVEETVPVASAPLPSPDTTDALWAPSVQEGRLLYGIPGEIPFLAVECDRSGGEPMLAFTRFARADRNAQAMMSLVGNFHVVRFPVDAIDNGRAWLWQGSVAAAHPEIDALTGQRAVEATIPGAGSVILNPSPRIRALVNACRPSEQPDLEEPDRDPPADESAAPVR